MTYIGSFSGARHTASELTTACNQDILLEMVKSVIPPMFNSCYKGQAGRVGIVGGSLE